MTAGQSTPPTPPARRASTAAAALLARHGTTRPVRRATGLDGRHREDDGPARPLSPGSPVHRYRQRR